MILQAKKGRGEKVHIMVDGEYTATTTMNFWTTIGPANGTDVSAEELESLLSQIAFRRMYDKALDLLSARDYSRHDLEGKLVQKMAEKEKKSSVEGAAPKQVDYAALRESAALVCNKLEELNLLNDERYARLYAAELVRNKHMSARGVRTQLMTKGISGSTADAVLQEMYFDNKGAITELLHTKFKNRDLRDEKQKQRTVAALVRLGYNQGDIFAAMGEYTALFSDTSYIED